MMIASSRNRLPSESVNEARPGTQPLEARVVRNPRKQDSPAGAAACASSTGILGSLTDCFPRAAFQSASMPGPSPSPARRSAKWRPRSGKRIAWLHFAIPDSPPSDAEIHALLQVLRILVEELQIDGDGPEDGALEPFPLLPRAFVKAFHPQFKIAPRSGAPVLHRSVQPNKDHCPGRPERALAKRGFHRRDFRDPLWKNKFPLSNNRRPRMPLARRQPSHWLCRGSICKAASNSARALPGSPALKNRRPFSSRKAPSPAGVSAARPAISACASSVIR